MPQETDSIADAAYSIIRDIGIGDVRSALAGTDTHRMLGRITESLVLHAGDDPALRATAATVLLHFSLTAASIPSQRKVESGPAYVDVAVPNLRSLKADPSRVLLICIPRQREGSIEEQVRTLQSIQPVSENIWIVADGGFGKRRTYDMDNGFAHILDDVAEFAAKNRIPRIGIGTL